MILDAVEYLVECWCRRKSGKLRRQILLQRLTGGSSPANEHIMDFLGNVSDLHMWHACILHAQVGHRAGTIVYRMRGITRTPPVPVR